MPCSLLSLQTSVDKEDFTSVEIYFSTQERRLAWSVWKTQRALFGREECFHYDNESWWWRARNEDKGVQSASKVTKQQKRFPHKGRWKSANQWWCSGNHKNRCYRTCTTDRGKDSPGYRTSRSSYWNRPCTPAHLNETKQSGHLVTRNSPFGWVVLGAMSGRIQQASSVLLVSYSSPVDLCNFWTTEAMGVAVKPCICSADKLTQLEREETRIIQSSCKKMGNQWVIAYPWKADPKLLPNNRSQAIKKLEATERWLQKNPENAEASNQQIQEMEQMKFSSTKDQSITLRIMKSYDLTRKVHLYQSYSIRLLFIKATDWTTIGWNARICSMVSLE